MLFCKRIERTSHPVIFLHGFLGTHADAKALLETKTLSWHLIDLPGHGKTGQQATFDDLKTYLDDLNSPFHLVGYSLGGRVAQALSHHPKCLSLTLISSHTLFDESGIIERAAFEERLKSDLLTKPFHEFVDEFYKSPLFTSLKRRKRIFEQMLLRRIDQSKNDILFALNELAISKIHSPLPKIPILGLYGMLDLKYRKLYTCLSESVHVVSIASSGHAICLENPKRCLEIIETFIGTIEHDLANLQRVSRH